jgi:hypothetical protein
MITLYGFGRVHEKVICETRDLRAQWALEETGLPYGAATIRSRAARTFGFASACDQCAMV